MLKLGRLVTAFAVILVVSSLLTVNDLLQAAAGGVAALIGLVVMRPTIVPIVPLALGFQWLQVSLPGLYANYLGIRLDHWLPEGDPERATYLGLAALSISTVLIALGSQRWARMDGTAVQDTLRRASLAHLLKLYGITLAVALALRAAIPVTSPFGQIVEGVEGLRWAALMLLIASSLAQRHGTGWVVAVLGLELAIGFSGFFAGFAAPLLFALLAFLTVLPILRQAQKTTAVVLVLLLAVLGITWQSIKLEYRREVAGPHGGQTVNIGLLDRYELLGQLALGSFDSDMESAVQRLAQRIGYVEYFGQVIERVPSRLPHRNGDLLWEAAKHVLTPRLLFPDKVPLPSDSVLTAQYTGNVGVIYMTGTSVSLGYVTEGYIDFGIAGVALMGVLYAGIFTGVAYAFRKVSPDPAVAVALTCATLLNARLFECSLPKLLGGTFAVCLVGLAVLFVAQDWIAPLLHGEARRRSPSVPVST
jgi:hypothetical protein